MTLNYILLITTLIYVFGESIGFGIISNVKKTKPNLLYNFIALTIIAIYNVIIFKIFNIQFSLLDTMLFFVGFLFIRFGLFDIAYNITQRQHNQKINNILFSSILLNNILDKNKKRYAILSVYFNVLKWLMFGIGMVIIVEHF